VNTENWLFLKRQRPLLRNMERQGARFTTETGLTDQAIYYSDSGIKRAAEYRTQSSWLLNAFSRPDSLVVPVARNKNLVKDGQPLIIPVCKVDSIRDHLQSRDPIFLGLTTNDDTPVFAIDVSDFFSAEGSKPMWLEGTELVDLRKYGPNLKASEAGLLAYARGMIEWHSQNRFCGHCGMRKVSKDGGHSLKCSSESCNAVVYPRLDPAVIMVIADGDYVLLGRQSKWEPGRYSVLAGFVEIGETFEMAIVREVQEEAGITVDRSSIRYVATQPWPFPSSLMVGFMASAEKNESSASKYSPMPREQVVPIDNLILSTICDIDSLTKPVVDGNELEDAKWIHKDFLRAVLSGKSLPPGVQFHVPGKYAIAHYLLDKWITESRCNKWAADEIETVQIDEGVFKYVLIRVHDNNGSQKLIVRGNSALAYHADILKQARDKIGPSRLQADPLGGGRIEHHPEQKAIHIYGFSQAYGQANHAVTAALLRQWLPFHEISVSWDGY
jgi:NAD+ diphosphatase